MIIPHSIANRIIFPHFYLVLFLYLLSLWIIIFLFLSVCFCSSHRIARRKRGFNDHCHRVCVCGMNDRSFSKQKEKGVPDGTIVAQYSTNGTQVPNMHTPLTLAGPWVPVRIGGG